MYNVTAGGDSGSSVAATFKQEMMVVPMLLA